MEHVSQDEIQAWEERFDEYYERVADVTNNLCHMHWLVWGQCSENMRAGSEGPQQLGPISEPKLAQYRGPKPLQGVGPNQAIESN